MIQNQEIADQMQISFQILVILKYNTVWRSLSTEVFYCTILYYPRVPQIFLAIAVVTNDLVSFLPAALISADDEWNLKTIWFTINGEMQILDELLPIQDIVFFLFVPLMLI